MSKKQLFAFALIGFILGITVAAIWDSFRLPTHGVFGEYGLTFTPKEIDWGNMTANTFVTRAINITNTGTKDFHNLTAFYGNETTNLINYSLSWNYEMKPLLIGESVLANFTLIIYNATEGAFSFDIYISENGT